MQKSTGERGQMPQGQKSNDNWRPKARRTKKSKDQPKSRHLPVRVTRLCAVWVAVFRQRLPEASEWHVQGVASTNLGCHRSANQPCSHLFVDEPQLCRTFVPISQSLDHLSWQLGPTDWPKSKWPGLQKASSPYLSLALYLPGEVQGH